MFNKSISFFIVLSTALISLSVQAVPHNETPEQRRERITKTYWQERRLKRAKQATSSLCSAGAAACLVTYFGNSIFGAIGAGSLIMTGQGLLQKFADNATMYTRFEPLVLGVKGTKIRDIDNLELQLRLRDDVLPMPVKEKIQTRIDTLRYETEIRPPMGMNISIQNQQNDPMETIKLMLNMPIRTKPIDNVRQIQENLRHYLETFEPVVQSFITQQVAKIVQNAQIADREGQAVKSSMYFVGPPGTGKTATAEIMGKVLGLDVCPISLSSITAGDLNGSKGASAVGVIAKCMGRNGSDGSNYKNKIIYFEEIHHALNSDIYTARQYLAILQELLDPDKPVFRDHALEMDVDVSRVIFIMAGNEPLSTPQIARAFRERFATLEFPPMSLEKRGIVAFSFFRNEAQVRNLPVDEDKDIALIKHMVQYDKNPGFRILKQVIIEYISFRKSWLEGWLNISPDFDFRAAFAERNPAGENSSAQSQ